VKKHLRAQEVAFENRLWFLLQTPAARPAAASGGVPRPRALGRIFYNQARMSAAGIPQVAVAGSCTAGGAYVPAMCDETVIVQNWGDDLPRRRRW
jgi:3-methylcrotonyl-CoA carboxylase beta subunit